MDELIKWLIIIGIGLGITLLGIFIPKLINKIKNVKVRGFVEKLWGIIYASVSNVGTNYTDELKNTQGKLTKEQQELAKQMALEETKKMLEESGKLIIDTIDGLNINDYIQEKIDEAVEIRKEVIKTK